MNQVPVQSQSYSIASPELVRLTSSLRSGLPFHKVTVYISCCPATLYSVAAPNTNTPGLFEMVRLLADRSAHDIKALRKQSKSTRTRMLSKHSRSSDRSVPLRCISNKPSINNGGRCVTIDAHGFANLHRHPNTANPTCSCSSP